MSGFQIGDRVRLLKLEDWFFKGIELDTVAFLKTCIGQTTNLVGFDEYGHAELEFSRPPPAGRTPDTIWVDQSWIEKV